ncbi:hypothetical protein [Streptomyces fulvoviolaceus]|uniref:hypothetical protein n=1 Tax=Streptomyces fulvoviolaceus TaxID=285535 RepID=UPI00069328F7|nr:hypothetical protein [Streptomyces fulvoviolaceus]
MPTFPHMDAGFLAVTALAAVEVAIVVMLFWRSRLGSSERPRRTSMTMVVSVIAAVACTACSAVTSWRFGGDYLGMHDTVERTVFFATGELALIASALIARQNLRGPRREAGAAGVLVWVFAAVLSISAYAEYGPVGGTVGAFFGPVMAAALWRQALGLDQPRHSPDAAGRDIRALLLARLGIVEQSPKTSQEPTTAPLSTPSGPPAGIHRPE